MPKPPRWLTVKLSVEKRTARALAMLPRQEPDIKIALTAGEEQEVVYNPAVESSLLPVIGAQGFYADYDAVTGEFVEASVEFNRRRVRYRHCWYIDCYRPGGAWVQENLFQVCWRDRTLYRAGTNLIYILDDWDGSVKQKDRGRVTPDDRVTWLDAERCTGRDEAGTLYSGNAIVDVGGQSFKSVRAIRLRADEWGERETGEPPVKWWCLDDIYLSSDGRIVLARRFRSRELRERDLWDNSRDGGEPGPDWSDWSAGRSKIAYNGFEFAHWYDILTDVSLGWPGPPPFR